MSLKPIKVRCISKVQLTAWLKEAGIDTVISCVGRNVIEHQVELVRLANDSPSVHRFFPSEYGTDIEHGPASANEKPHQKKLKVRAALQACDRLDYTCKLLLPLSPRRSLRAFIIEITRRAQNATVPGQLEVWHWLAGNERCGGWSLCGWWSRSLFWCQQDLQGSWNIRREEQRGRAHWGWESESQLHHNERVNAIAFSLANPANSFDSVGKLVVQALRHPEASRNKALRVNSFTTTDSEILKEFEKHTGGNPWKVSYTSVDRLKQLEQEAWDAEKPYATLFTLRRIWAEGGTLYEQRDNHLIEAEDVMESLADAVAEAVRVQTSWATNRRNPAQVKVVERGSSRMHTWISTICLLPLFSSSQVHSLTTRWVKSYISCSRWTHWYK